MTKNEIIIKERIDKILKNSLSEKNIVAIYEIYNTKEVQEFLDWKPTWKITLNEWYKSLDDFEKSLVRNLIILFNNQPLYNKKEKNKKMEEIKVEEVKQQEVVEVEKPKVKRAPKRSKEFYDAIIKEIDELKSSGKKVSEIMNILKQKYNDVNPGTLMAKYFAWKRNQNKQGE